MQQQLGDLKDRCVRGLSNGGIKNLDVKPKRNYEKWILSIVNVPITRSTFVIIIVSDDHVNDNSNDKLGEEATRERHFHGSDSPEDRTKRWKEEHGGLESNNAFH